MTLKIGQGLDLENRSRSQPWKWIITSKIGQGHILYMSLYNRWVNVVIRQFVYYNNVNYKDYNRIQVYTSLWRGSTPVMGKTPSIFGLMNFTKFFMTPIHAWTIKWNKPPFPIINWQPVFGLSNSYLCLTFLIIITNKGIYVKTKGNWLHIYQISSKLVIMTNIWSTLVPSGRFLD